MLRTKGKFNIAIRLLLTFGLFYGIYMISTRALGYWFYRQPAPEGLYKAIEWDPGNHYYYSALGRFLQKSSEEVDPEIVIQLFQKATTLSPHQARYWADLGGAFEWAARKEEALGAFERARDLFPNSPEINWRLGNYYLRDGKTVEALKAFRKVLIGEPALANQVFELAWRAGVDADLILETMIPSLRQTVFRYLGYLIRTEHIDEAEEVWGNLLSLGLRFEPKAAFPYIDALVRHERVAELADTWSALEERFPALIRPASFDTNLITNGSFENIILNGGLDWRVSPVKGVVVRVDNFTFFDGTNSLQFVFDGKNNISYGHAFQYVLVKPNTNYRFIGYMRTQRITTDNGVHFQIFDYYDRAGFSITTDTVVGTVSWSPHSLEFRTGPETRLLVVRVARSPSRKIDNMIAGKLWIDRIRLTSGH